MLISDAVITANNAGFDVFNALTLMDNMPILPELKVSRYQSAFFLAYHAIFVSLVWVTGSSTFTCIIGGHQH